MIKKIDADETTWLDDDLVERELATLGHRNQLSRVGLVSSKHKKKLVAFARLGQREELHPGYPWINLRCAGQQWDSYGVRCQTALELQSAIGCPFECSYCPYGDFLSVRLDVEAIAERMMSVVENHPVQKLFKLNNRTDTLGLEPEYNMAPILIKQFARLSDKYLMLYSKGVEVDHLINLDHGSKTVACWTLTPEGVANWLEPGAPDIRSRLVAIAKMASAGYPIRIRFSPIVPIVEWEKAYMRLIRALKEKAKPEMITLWTLSMIDPSQLDRIVPLSRLCPDIIKIAQKENRAVKGTKGAPFSERIRIEIYRTIIAMIKSELPSTHVAICLESKGVWLGLENQLSTFSSKGFHCNCGPISTPRVLQTL